MGHKTKGQAELELRKKEILEADSLGTQKGKAESEKWCEPWHHCTGV